MKLLDFFKRYYRCIFDYKLFKSYLHESVFKALLFLMPLFLLMVISSVLVTMTNPNAVVKNLDHYYDHVNKMIYADVTTQANGFDLTDPLNLEFFDGAVQIPQTKLYDETFNANGQNYRLILDTHNSLGIEAQNDGRYDAQVQTRIGHQTSDMSVYVNKDFVLISVNGSILTHDLSIFKGTSNTTLGIYTFVKDNYRQPGVYFIAMLFITSFLYLMFYVVVYIIAKSTVKRHGYQLSRSRMVKVCLYSIQPGMYTYFALDWLTRITGINITFIIPLLAMIAMSYVATKNLENMKDYVKKEIRQAQKIKKKAELQA